MPTTFYHIFTTNYKWQVVTGCYWWEKSDFSGRFKFEPITTYNL